MTRAAEREALRGRARTLSRPRRSPETWWYAASDFWELRADLGTPRPHSVAHAKRMGTLVTACGLATTSWRKFYDVEFPVSAGLNCEACLLEISDPTSGLPSAARADLNCSRC